MERFRLQRTLPACLAPPIGLFLAVIARMMMPLVIRGAIPYALTLLAAVFIAIGVVRLPLVPVLLSAIPLSIAHHVRAREERRHVNETLGQRTLHDGVDVRADVLACDRRGEFHRFRKCIVLPSRSRHWMTDAQFADMFAISQLSPGPNVLIVTLIGYHVAGIAGALVATFAMCGPSAVICLFRQQHLLSPSRESRLAVQSCRLRWFQSPSA
jgi:hypothetical protein